MPNLFLVLSLSSFLFSDAYAEESEEGPQVVEPAKTDSETEDTDGSGNDEAKLEKTNQNEQTQDAADGTKGEDKDTEKASKAIPVFQEQMTLAEQQLKSNNLDGALSSLEKAEKEMSKSSTILTSNEISQVWYYRGVAESLQGKDPLESWRQALIINLGQKWDAELLSDSASQDLFLALKTEVQNRRIVSIQHPEQFGHAKLYVDGFLRAPGDFVYQGQHLAQIECPNGEVYGKWTNFEKKFKWIKMCPYKFDVTDMPEPEAVDEWDMFGGSFGGEESAPDVNMSNQVVADPLLQRMNKPTLYGSIASAAVAGVLYGVANKNNGEFENLDSGLTVEELDALRSTTNTIAISSMTFGVLSGGLYMYSMSTAKISD